MSAEPESGTWPDPERLRLIRYATHPSPLDSVAEAVSVASERHRTLYVERDREGWRWSLTAQGGPYPLLRITAQFFGAIIDGSPCLSVLLTVDCAFCVAPRSAPATFRGPSWSSMHLYRLARLPSASSKLSMGSATDEPGVGDARTTPGSPIARAAASRHSPSAVRSYDIGPQRRCTQPAARSTQPAKENITP